MSLALFRSIRFNILLFVMILAASALGSVVPESWQYDLYGAPWFIALLALMAFDIVVCKLYNAPPDFDLRLPVERVEDVEDRIESQPGKPYRAAFAARGADGALEKASAILRRRGYGVELHGSGTAVVAVRSRLQRWGSYAAHIGLVVLLIGALMKALFGFEEQLPVLEGSSKTMKHRPWQVHVDKFKVEYYEGTLAPKHFSSEVRVFDKSKAAHELEEGELMAEKTILVNEPLSLPGSRGLGLVRLYQASWGATGMLRSATLALGDKTLQVPMKTRTPLPGTGVAVEVNMMLPNFTVGKDNKPDTLSLEPLNPAVQVTFYKEGQATAPLWLLQNFPDKVFVEDEQGFLHDAPPPPFRLAAVDPMLFSGLQIAYDPGIPVLYLGFAVFMTGLCSLFYLHRRKVWVWAVYGERPKIVVGGWSSRKNAFHNEFTELVGALRAELG